MHQILEKNLKKNVKKIRKKHYRLRFVQPGFKYIFFKKTKYFIVGFA